MISNFKLLFIAMAMTFTVLVSSCKKEEDDHNHNNSSDTDKPVLAISTPTDGSMYNNGDTIRIKGTVTDASLHELLIRITDDTNNTVLYQQTPTVHDLTSYNIDTYWKSSVSAHTTATLTISVEDHSSNVATQSMKVHIHP